MRRLFIWIFLIMNIPVLLHSEGKWNRVDSLYFYDVDSIYTMSLSFVGIDCVDSMNCVAFANYNVDKPINRMTKDGGKTWSTTLFDTSYIKVDEDWNFIYYTPTKVKDVAYPSQNLCIAICDSGYHWISRDTLKTWKRYKFDTQYTLTGIHFLNEKIGVITGIRTLFLTSDGGANWEKIIFPYKETHQKWSIDASFLVNEKTLYCLIYDGVDTSSYMYRSYDLGHSWNYMKISNIRYTNLVFLDENIGWIAGGNQIASGSSNYKNVISLTSDGGVTWESQLDTLYGTKERIIRIYFTDNKNGYVLTHMFILWRTTNGGKTWFNDKTLYPKSQLQGPLIDIAPINPNKIFGVEWKTKGICLYTDDETDVEEYPKINNNSELLIFPNPLSSSGAIKYNLKEPGAVEIKLYDVLGNHLQTLFSGYRDAGFVSIDFSVETIPIGVYYIVFKHNNNVLVEKFVKI